MVNGLHLHSSFLTRGDSEHCRILPNIHPFIYTLIQPFSPFMHTLSHACTHSPIHTHIHPFMHTFSHACTHSPIHTHIQSCIHTFTHSYTHSPIHTHIHPFMHTFTHSYTHTPTDGGVNHARRVRCLAQGEVSCSGTPRHRMCWSRGSN